MGYEPRVPLDRGFSGYVTNPADEGSYDVAPAIAMNGPGSGSGKRRVPSLRRDSLGSPLVSAVRVSRRPQHGSRRPLLPRPAVSCRAKLRALTLVCLCVAASMCGRRRSPRR